MDDAEILKMSGISASGVAIVLLVYRVLKTINGKKIRSRCCGRTMEVGVEVGDLTPKPLEVKVNPMVEKKLSAENNVLQVSGGREVQSSRQEVQGNVPE
jgi:hypothetical protein